MNLRILQDQNIYQKTVLLRLDLNLPDNGKDITDFTRLEKILPTVKYILNQKAKVIILAHRGRPKSIDLSLSLKPIAEILSRVLNQKVLFSKDLTIPNLQDGDVLLLENIRFYPQEILNDLDFAKTLANMADIYVNDAFSVSHRAHASIEQIAHLLPSCAGLLLQNELSNIEKILYQPKHPFAAIIGGSKISTKLELLNNLLGKLDLLVIGGAMANSFLKAQKIAIGASVYETELVDVARRILDEHGHKIILPIDARVATNFNEQASIVSIESIESNQCIYDLGPKTCNLIIEKLSTMKTIVWNGPLGVCEYPQFAVSSALIAQTLAKLTKEGNILTIAGGGDVVSAINQAGCYADFSYISTAGGAFLEWLEGKKLPGIEVLKDERNK